MYCNYMTAGGGKPLRLSGEDMGHCSLELEYWRAVEDIPTGVEDGIESYMPLVQVCGGEGQILMALRHGKLTE